MILTAAVSQSAHAASASGYSPRHTIQSALADHCQQNAYIWIYPQAKQVVLSAAESENIGRYSFSHHVLNKTFCTVCGVCMTNEYAHRSKEELKELAAVPTRGFAQSMKNSHPLNLRILHDIDWDKLPKPMRNDGARKISPKYKDP